MNECLLQGTSHVLFLNYDCSKFKYNYLLQRPAVCKLHIMSGRDPLKIRSAYVKIKGEQQQHFFRKILPRF